MESPRRSLDITNIGVFEVQGANDLQGLYFVPILSPNYEKAIGIVTSGGRLDITMLYDCSQINVTIMEGFGRRAMEYIEAGIESRPQ
jgi:hypothetical protein